MILKSSRPAMLAFIPALLMSTAASANCPVGGVNMIGVAVTSTCNLSMAGKGVHVLQTGSIIKNGASALANASPIYAAIDGKIGDITIDGRIENPTGGGTNAGIWLVEGGLGSIEIDNILIGSTGIIQNVARGINLNSATVNNDIINNGLIHATGLGIYFVDETTLNASLINNGTIRSGSNAVAAGGLGARVIHGTFENYGTWIGATSAISVDTVVQGGIYNHISANMAGRVSASTSDFFNDGTLTLKSGVNIANIAETGGVAAESFVGNFTQGATGILRIYADGLTTRNTNYSALTVSGTATVEGVIDVDVRAGLPTAGVLENVIQAGTLAAFLPTVTDNSITHRFEAVDDGSNNIDLMIFLTGLTNIEGTTQSGTNAGNAARILDGNVDLQGLFGNLNGSQEIAKAVETTLPIVAGDARAVVGGGANAVTRIVQARIEGNYGLSSGDDVAADGHAWAKPFVNKSDQEASSEYSGYQSTAYGIVVGADKVVADDLRAGIALSAGQTDVKARVNGAKQSADVDSYQLISYGSYNLKPDLELHFQADVGYSNIDTRREIPVISAVASGDTDNWRYHVGGGIGKALPVNEATTLNLIARADYSHNRSDGYTEKGAGLLNLSVSDDSSNEFITSVEARAVTNLDQGFAVEATLGVGYDWINDRSKVTTAYQGSAATFTTEGYERNPFMGHAGLGLSKTFENGMRLLGEYEVDAREDYLSHTASAKARWSF